MVGAAPAERQAALHRGLPEVPDADLLAEQLPGYTGPAAGTTNVSTYGDTYKRDLTVNGTPRNIPIVLPKVCGKPGGTTGSIAGWPYGRVDRLQSGQRYGLIANTVGFSRNVVNLTNSLTNATLIPGACAVKGYSF